MPTDFNQPTTSTAYATFLSNLMARDVSAITLCKADPSNIPTNAIKYERVANKFQEYADPVAASWNDLVLSIVGGGTGAITAAAARTNLGLGSVSTQDASAVALTGGTISAGVAIAAGAIQSGTIAPGRLGSGSGGAGLKFLADDSTYKVGASKQYTVTNVNVISSVAKIATMAFTVAAADLADGDVIMIEFTYQVKQNTGGAQTVAFELAFGATTVALAAATSWSDNASILTSDSYIRLERCGTALKIRQANGGSAQARFMNGTVWLDDLSSFAGLGMDSYSMTPDFTLASSVELRLTLSANSADFFWKTIGSRAYKLN